MTSHDIVNTELGLLVLSAAGWTGQCADPAQAVAAIALTVEVVVVKRAFSKSLEFDVPFGAALSRLLKVNCNKQLKLTLTLMALG